MKLAKKLIVVIIFIAILGGLTWLSTEVYITALQIGTAGAVTIHTASIIFWALFMFSFFSEKMISGEHIHYLYRLCNIVFGIMFYLFLGSVFLSIMMALLPTVSTTFAWTIIILSFTFSIIGLIQDRKSVV